LREVKLMILTTSKVLVMWLGTSSQSFTNQIRMYLVLITTIYPKTVIARVMTNQLLSTDCLLLFQQNFSRKMKKQKKFYA